MQRKQSQTLSGIDRIDSERRKLLREVAQLARRIEALDRAERHILHPARPKDGVVMKIEHRKGGAR